MKWWQRRPRTAPQVALDALEMAELLQRSRSWDGFEREAVVTELCRRDDPAAIGALLVGCGDWVPQVRRTAQQGLRQFLRSECVPRWATAWPELAFLRRVQRVDVSALLADIERFVTLHIDAFDRQAQLSSPNPERQRWVFGLRLKQDLPKTERSALLCQGVQSSDLPLARRALQAARHLDAQWGQAVFEAALRSRLPRIRDAAARALLRLPAVHGQRLLRELCFDDSAELRATAAALLHSGREIVAARAVAVLDNVATSPRQQGIALHALSLLEKPAALARATQRLEAASTSLRRMARSLRLQAVQDAALDEEMLTTLADPSAKVRRLVVELVRRGTTAPSAEALRALGLQRMELAADIFAILRRGSPWERLSFALELLSTTTPEPALRQRIKQELKSWAAVRFFVQPDAQQRARLAALWGDHHTGLRHLHRLVGTDMVEKIETRLRAFQVLERARTATIIRSDNFRTTP